METELLVAPDISDHVPAPDGEDCHWRVMPVLFVYPATVMVVDPEQVKEIVPADAEPPVGVQVQPELATIFTL